MSPALTDVFETPGRIRQVLALVAPPLARDWRLDPRAAAILASIAITPPPMRDIPYVDRWTSATEEYAGYRVECLERIYGEHLMRYLAPAEIDGDWSAWDAFRAFPDVQDAVHEALNPPVEPDFWRDTFALLRPVTLGAVA